MLIGSLRVGLISFPEQHEVVGRSGQEVQSGGGEVDVPDGSGVAAEDGEANF